MMNADERIQEIATRIAPKFRTFGGGDIKPRGWSNPIAAALKHHNLEFAAGVDVLEVVRAVLEADREISAEAEKHATPCR